MATVAAYDIRTSLLAQVVDSHEVVCYTFAAPRTGNHAFARDYNAMVPDTWSVINDQVSPCMASAESKASVAVVCTCNNSCYMRRSCCAHISVKCACSGM